MAHVAPVQTADAMSTSRIKPLYLKGPASKLQVVPSLLIEVSMISVARFIDD